MPLYEYVCRACQSSFEALVFGGKSPICPACSGADLEKVFSSFAVNSGGFAKPSPSVSSCGSCGDPRGPGSCTTSN